MTCSHSTRQRTRNVSSMSSHPCIYNCDEQQQEEEEIVVKKSSKQNFFCLLFCYTHTHLSQHTLCCVFPSCEFDVDHVPGCPISFSRHDGSHPTPVKLLQIIGTPFLTSPVAMRAPLSIWRLFCILITHSVQEPTKAWSWKALFGFLCQLV
eukprot:m.121488 g.121488  ORF g.121488 m.121488 type:complete len:151 (-) comp15523_c0_seq1:526-978(-)